MNFDLEAWLHDPRRRADERLRVAEHLERRMDEEREAAAACARKDCVYACPDCMPRDLKESRRHVHDHACAGYAVTFCIEHGQPLIRTRLCQRRVRWTRNEAEKEQRRKIAAAAQVKALPAPKSWIE